MLARALASACRTWSLYPRDHPSCHAAVDRLEQVCSQAIPMLPFSLAVTPTTLLVGGAAPPDDDPAVGSVAALLHDRDLIRLTFFLVPPADALRRLLDLLKRDQDELRREGGPARVWAAAGDPSIAIEQVDYTKLLADRADGRPIGKRDDVWRAIAHSITGERRTLDAALQRRLLEIAGDPAEIVELAREIMASRVTAGGAPMILAQAAVVLAAFRQIVSVASVAAPDRLEQIFANLAAATNQLDPGVMARLVLVPEREDRALVGRLLEAFDDERAARLLASILAAERRPTERLAEVLGTIAPDSGRRARILELTRSRLRETDFGAPGEFSAVWKSLETLVLAYDERPFVSDDYRGALDQAYERADAMAAGSRPPELARWLDSVAEPSVHRLSVLLLADLLRLERDGKAAAALTADLAAAASDLLLAGDYANAEILVGALARAAATPRHAARQTARAALEEVMRSDGARETLALIADLDDRALDAFRSFCEAAGPACTIFLRTALADEAFTPARRRASEIIVRYGAEALPFLTPLLNDDRATVQRNVVELITHIGGRDLVRLVQPLLRRGDPQVLPQVVAALVASDDPAASRLLLAAIRSAAGPARDALYAAVLAQRVPRAVPLVGQVLEMLDPLGRDHARALAAVRALGDFGDDRAVPLIVATLGRRKLFARRKTRDLYQAAVAALLKLGSPAAAAALEDAARRGNRTLRKLVRRARPA